MPKEKLAGLINDNWKYAHSIYTVYDGIRVDVRWQQFPRCCGVGVITGINRRPEDMVRETCIGLVNSGRVLAAVPSTMRADNLEALGYRKLGIATPNHRPNHRNNTIQMYSVTYKGFAKRWGLPTIELPRIR